MKILIEYESSWRNSFLDGDNNKDLQASNRNYLGSMTALKEEGNFIQRAVSLDTVMGLLNRLIGDQRKLYQARMKKGSQTYFFEDIESKITFEDTQYSLSNEIVYLRNLKGSTDQNSFTGMIKSQEPILNSDYSTELWGILKLDLNELCSFILFDTKIDKNIETDPLEICVLFESLEKLKPVEKVKDVAEVLNLFSQRFPGIDYLNKKGLVISSSLYCSALYLQLERLAKRFDMTSALTKSGGISGISKRGFTKKDFMDRFTTGRKKMIWGNPYIRKRYIKGQGEEVSMLTKANGKLEITIDVDQHKAREIENLIENAGVSSFYIGKKGLAYVSKIRI